MKQAASTKIFSQLPARQISTRNSLIPAKERQITIPGQINNLPALWLPSRLNLLRLVRMSGMGKRV
ncbi:hypothetical protein C0081_13705 [Cohaesibacter celericrescens]|uniref:Uncharacterized protein n=1 Tax=Cohaesibacter celericrescens TaxID=2067669 RepID=A0A2N5XQ76_9HYPH|nr:hypothetical protein C0081_13705 [Cohaesibacter celericrescens]